MAGVAGSTIGIGGVQPVIGTYVQDSLDPRANTNYIGVNVLTAYEHNVLAQGTISPTEPAPQPNWIVPMDDNAVTGGLGQWVKNGATALVPGDKVTITAGAAAKDNAAGTHNVFATVPANYFFWAPAVA